MKLRQPTISVIIPTHKPDTARFIRTLTALIAQTLHPSIWEILIIDNANLPSLSFDSFRNYWPQNARIVREPNLGLTAARFRGFSSARGELIVLVDDDNVLKANYLAEVLRIFSENPRVGAIGGKSLPEFEVQPAVWAREFLPLLALRDEGDLPCLASGLSEDGAGRNRYPSVAAPIGAGMALRRQSVEGWITSNGATRISDRYGKRLTSGGDNDIVFSVLKAGWQVGYFPSLNLIHLIPEFRLTKDYLGRLNFGIQKSWIEVLVKYDACPWERIDAWTTPLRKIKAAIREQPWKGPGAWVRWCGLCGRLEGLSEANYQRRG